jgi:hypothetical protein
MRNVVEDEGIFTTLPPHQGRDHIIDRCIVEFVREPFAIGIEETGELCKLQRSACMDSTRGEGGDQGGGSDSLD